MKGKSFLLAALLLIMAVGIAAPAFTEESDVYYVNMPILKIYPHTKGYYIIYRRNGLTSGEFFIPKAWLDNRDQRAVMNLYSANITPYITLVTKKGEFDHIRINAPKNTLDPTWGALFSGAQYDEKFNVEKLELKY